MRTRVVRRYTPPGYPTRQYLMEHPELLRWIPERWRRQRLVLAVLSMVIPLIVSRPAMAGDAKSAPVTASRVAPLFIHGDGRGSFGCIVVNPPVFLSEDEARQVVQDEVQKAGIAFTADDLTLKDVMVPVTNRFGSLEEEDRNKEDANHKLTPPRTPQTQKRDLVLDGYDKKHNIAYEVVSKKDFDEWETKNPGWRSTVSEYDFKTTAEGLTNGLADTEGKTILAVFYEPAASAPYTYTAPPEKGATEADRWKARQQASKELGEEELREQVRDFLEWLKAQGVI